MAAPWYGEESPLGLESGPQHWLSLGPQLRLARKLNYLSYLGVNGMEWNGLGLILLDCYFSFILIDKIN